jgi:pyruvate dehydrogenase E2 component (dihydrolipoamide acetyltransferase)
MSNKIVMPTLGLTMESGLIVSWLKEEGDDVEKGEDLVEIESDKATSTIESEYSGVLLKIYYPEGSEVPCTKTIAVIGEEGEVVPEIPPDTEADSDSKDVEQGEAAEAEPRPEAPASAETGAVERPDTGGGFSERAERERARRIIASPRARHYARTRGIELERIGRGSGQRGRIQEKDVIEYENHGKSGAAESAGMTAPSHGFTHENTYEIPVSRMRRTIARRLTESKRNIPQYTLELSVCMEGTFAERRRITQEEQYRKVSLNSLIVKTVADVVGRHSMVNATWAEDKIIVSRQVDMGVAVSTEEGLVAPVVRACESKDLWSIHEELQDLVERAQRKELKTEELEGASFTVSNLGMYEVERFSAIINPPGSVILAVGSISEKPVGADGTIRLRPMMQVTLTCDHRVVDGAVGAAFLQDLKHTFEKKS